MKRKPKSLPTCDACGRPQNDSSVLATMFHRDIGAKPMYICGAGGCWTKANDRGYFAASQERPAPENG
jgi:hypothetical protein